MILKYEPDSVPQHTPRLGVPPAPPGDLHATPDGASPPGFHPGGNPGSNLKSTSYRCYLFEVAFVWELTKETIDLPLGCLQGGSPLACRRVRSLQKVCTLAATTACNYLAVLLFFSVAVEPDERFGKNSDWVVSCR